MEPGEFILINIAIRKSSGERTIRTRDDTATSIIRLTNKYITDSNLSHGIELIYGLLGLTETSLLPSTQLSLHCDRLSVEELQGNGDVGICVLRFRILASLLVQFKWIGNIRKDINMTK